MNKAKYEYDKSPVICLTSPESGKKYGSFFSSSVNTVKPTAVTELSDEEFTRTLRELIEHDPYSPVFLPPESNKLRAEAARTQQIIDTTASLAEQLESLCKL